MKRPKFKVRVRCWVPATAEFEVIAEDLLRAIEKAMGMALADDNVVNLRPNLRLPHRLEIASVYRDGKLIRGMA